ncbi:TonB-dependent receptor [Parapedobacter deserti]
MMKLAIILTFVVVLQATAGSVAQTITLNLRHVPLTDAMHAIRQQSGHLYLLKGKALAQMKVGATVRGASLEQAMNDLLAGTGLEWVLKNNTIVISKAPESAALPGDNLGGTAMHRAQQRTIGGKVTDEAGAPVEGVTVAFGASTAVTTTDGGGNFQLNVEGTGNLVFSAVGFETQQLSLTDQRTVNITLVAAISDLDEVVVVGYGTARKRDLTGSVVSIQERDFAQGVNNNALQLLNGKASGVHISQSSSAPGAATSIRIRGAGSINSSNEVLVVVDGLPGATMDALNPGDIESIEVLKDASAAAIYGTRAANGVVLVTTKKGKSGKPRTSYNGYVGLQDVAKRIDVLSARQYMEVLNSILADQGEAPLYTDQEINDASSGTDWQDEIFRTAAAHDHRLAFSGGGNHSNYYISLNYFNQAGVVLGSNLDKYNVRLNYELKPTDRLDLKFNVNTNRWNNKRIYESNSANEFAGPINTALQFDPTLPAGLDESGRYQINPVIALENPLALIHGFDERDMLFRSFGTFTADYRIFEGFTATARLGADFANNRTDSYNSRLTTRGLASGGIGSIRSGENFRWLAEFLGQYDKEFGRAHHLSAVAGITFEEFNNRSATAAAANFLSDVTGVDQLQSGDRGQFTVNSSRSRNRLNSFLGRVNYRFNDKYLVTASLRADGTSRFAADNKYAFFPSMAVAWRISEEAFLQQQSLLSDLKLRAGFGRLGNQGINNFETFQTFVVSGAAVLGDQVVQGAAPARIPNPGLRWETSEEINVGLDFGLWRNRLSGALEYFVKSTKDQLFSKPVPGTTGFTNTRVNFGNVQNSGIEVTLNSLNTTGAFEWRTSLNLSVLRNKVTELPDFIPELIGGSVGTFISNYTIVRRGVPMRSFYGYEITGFFQEGDNIGESAQPDAHPGHPIFRDVDGNGVINADDRVILGDPFPDYTIGLSNSFMYKGVGLDFQLVAVQGIETLDANILESLYPINFNRNRIAAHYLDRWTPQNPGAAYPSGINPSSYGGARAINSLTVTDASFIRLRSVTLSYAFPERFGKWLSGSSVFLAGDNLFTITNFEGFDPDANASANSGVNASASNIDRTSYNSYPLSRTIRLGINLTL